MPRLRRVRPTDPGWTRAGKGRRVRYLDESGAPITDPTALERIRSLVIPPAWRDVWICPRDNGHIQATGVDAAGRRQYLYHPQWRARRDRAKHDHVVEVAARLPAARRRVRQDLLQPGLPRTKVLALAFRLLDVAYFRAGGEVYAKANGSYGLATLRREHVRFIADGVRFRYPAKSGQLRDVVVDDPGVRRLVAQLRRRRGGDPQLLAYREGRSCSPRRSRAPPRECQPSVKPRRYGASITGSRPRRPTTAPPAPRSEPSPPRRATPPGPPARPSRRSPARPPGPPTSSRASR